MCLTKLQHGLSMTGNHWKQWLIGQQASGQADNVTFALYGDTQGSPSAFIYVSGRVVIKEKGLSIIHAFRK
jgi:hypothetical protein